MEVTGTATILVDFNGDQSIIQIGNGSYKTALVHVDPVGVARQFRKFWTERHVVTQVIDAD